MKILIFLMFSMTGFLVAGNGGLNGQVAKNRQNLDLLAALKTESLAEIEERINKGASSNAQYESQGYTALQLSILLKMYDKADLLLQKGALPNTLNKSGDTALHIASRTNPHVSLDGKAIQERIAIIEKLIEFGAYESLNIKNNSLRTPIEEATEPAILYYLTLVVEHKEITPIFNISEEI